MSDGMWSGFWREVFSKNGIDAGFISTIIFSIMGAWTLAHGVALSTVIFYVVFCSGITGLYFLVKHGPQWARKWLRVRRMRDRHRQKVLEWRRRLEKEEAELPLALPDSRRGDRR